MKGVTLGLLLCFMAVLGYGCMPTYRCLSTNYKSSLDIRESATATVGSVMVRWETWEDCVGEQGGRVFTRYTQDEFNQELIYSGLQGNTIFLLYREYRGRLIRDAFTQHLTYDLTKSKILTFRAALIEVEEATNAYIKYRLMSQIAPEYRKK